MNKLRTVWAEAKGTNHLFASDAAGIISMCGARRHPKTGGEDAAAPFCFACAANLRLILNPERYTSRAATPS